MTLIDDDQALADAVYLCFAGAPDDFMTSAIFDRIQLKLMRLIEDTYNEGFQNGLDAIPISGY